MLRLLRGSGPVYTPRDIGGRGSRERAPKFPGLPLLETPEVWRLDCAQFGKTSIREITIEEIQRAEHSTALASVAALLTAAVPA